MGSPSVHLAYKRDLSGQDHASKVEAVEALERAGVEKLPKELAAYFDEEFVGSVDPDKPQTLQEFSFDDYSASQQRGGRVGRGHASLKYLDGGEMETGVRIDVSKLPEGTRFIDVVLSY